MRPTAFLRYLALMLPLAACGAISGVDGEGTFTAQVTGALTDTLEGKATLDEIGFPTGKGYVISMFDSGGRRVFLYSLAKPGPGTYEVHAFTPGGPPGEGFNAAFWTEPNGGGIFTSVGGGEVVITRSGGGLAGTFRFEAVDRPDLPEPQTVTISGSFTLN